jgi:hypothetical protein
MKRGFLGVDGLCVASILKGDFDSRSGLGGFYDRDDLNRAAAQRYDPAYPVCLHVYGWEANYYECGYTSLPQCNASASGRAAECVINPYFASAQVPLTGTHYRHHRRVY